MSHLNILRSEIAGVFGQMVMLPGGDNETIPNELKYVEEELDLFWEAPQGECFTLFVVVITLICLDAFIARRVNIASVKTHACMVAFWITCGLAYNVIYGMRHGARDGVDWFVGYALEWMLSLDNLFAFQFIMRAYSAPPAIQHKALFCGVLGAMVWRLLMFFAIGFLMHSIHYVQFVFGFILIYQGVQALRGDDEDTDPNEMLFIRGLKMCLGSRLLDSYDLENHRVFVWDENGRLCATLMVPLIFCIELSDLIFAVDSVSAKVAQIPNQYIAYSSSVLALLGLRAMYFVIDDLVRYFDQLKYGVCFILVFIGGELMISGRYQLPEWVVCIVIVSVCNFCIVLSLLNRLIWHTPATSDTAAGVSKAGAATKGPGGILTESCHDTVTEECGDDMSMSAGIFQGDPHTMSSGSSEPLAAPLNTEAKKSSSKAVRSEGADSAAG